MDELTYSSFSSGIRERIGTARTPLSVAIEVTHRCPLACAHCYVNQPMNDAEIRAGELTLAEHRRLLDEIADLGCFWLLYTGGEIFARRDFLDIYTYAKRKGFLITLFTNGTMVTPRVADHLAEWPPFVIEVTLYGATRVTFDLVTGVPGSFDRCMRGVRRILDRGLPLKLKAMCLSRNVHELQAMRAIADSLGVRFSYDPMINPRIDCGQRPLAVRITPEEAVAFDAIDTARAASWRKFGEKFYAPGVDYTPGCDLYSCGGGHTAFAISPEGRMSLCFLSRKDTYDIRAGSVREGWQSFLGTVRQRKATRETKCTRCTLRPLCGMCPANGELESGDPESPVEFLCEVGHLRAHLLGYPVASHGDCEYCTGGARHERVQAAADRLKAKAAGAVSPEERPPAATPSCWANPSPPKDRVSLSLLPTLPGGRPVAQPGDRRNEG